MIENQKATFDTSDEHYLHFVIMQTIFRIKNLQDKVKQIQIQKILF